MGPTSSWAFCRRVLAAIGSHTPDPEPPLRPWDLETLNLTWNPIGLNEQPDVESLPSYEYAVFNLAAVKYHLGPFSEIIDYDEFDQRLKQFYESPATEAKHARYWYSQLLFVLAFGEAFNATGTSKSVPGVGYASRALSLLPTMIPMEKEPLRAAEALCLGALYLQALDLRLMSFQLVSRRFRNVVLHDAKLDTLDRPSSASLCPRWHAQTYAAPTSRATTRTTMQHRFLVCVHY